MVTSQRHRGPDGDGIYIDSQNSVGLGHNRLSIIDLSDAGRQPMFSHDRNLVITYNGEIYNYLELRRELESTYQFRTRSDTEVLLAAYQKWGAACLDKLVGMFAFVIWDVRNRTAFAARDRFGVKPFYYHQKDDGTFVFASEIKAIHAAGVPQIADNETWATYLACGLYDHSERTFWRGVHALPGGHCLSWCNGRLKILKWYDLAERVGDVVDERPENEVKAEYFQLMKESVELRFRSDVPVGINLSGGLDSSSLLGLVNEVQGTQCDVKAFTFTAGNKNYDELPWVRRMLETTNHPLVVGKLAPADVPGLAQSVQNFQDEPFGGLPTIAYAKLFDEAKRNGVKVLLDGNGMDEQWAGYDYYRSSFADGHQPGIVQGTKDSPVRPECLTPEFRALAQPLESPNVFSEKLRNIQYRDSKFTKIPRAMRFNDRISMRSSTELREPFLDHRLFELALRQPADRKINGETGKVMLRQIAKKFVGNGLPEAPKRAMQTPQREWLRGPLKEWAKDQIQAGLAGPNGCFFDRSSVRTESEKFFDGGSDNSFFLWQWITLGLMREVQIAAAKI